jgi:glycosyltransferase involved in cell wall biosynthesis
VQARDITAVVATRGRPDGVIRTVRSLLRSADPQLRVIVIDQSEIADHVKVVNEFKGESRVSLVAAKPRGLGAARNVGVLHAASPIIAFTDDDCEVGPTWLDDFATAFSTDTRIGIVLGEVRAIDYDRRAGCIPAYAVEKPQLIRSLRHKARAEGIGACMAIRRSSWDAIGGFDEMFGAGAPLRAAEDSDFFMRALQAGSWVYETPEVGVTHFGFRSWPDMPTLIEGYMVGLGAAYAKSLRLGGIAALQPILTLAWRWMAGRPVIDLGPRPSRPLRLAAFLRGARLGFRLPIDRLTGRFHTRERSQAAATVALRTESQTDKVD